MPLADDTPTGAPEPAWRSCAIHESGHAVVALELGWRVRGLEIGRDESVCRMRAREAEHPLVAAIEYATVLAAGVAAEVLEARLPASHDRPLYHFAGETDRDRAETALTAACDGDPFEAGPLWDFARLRARRILLRRWADVDHLAACVVANGGALEGEDTIAVELERVAWRTTTDYHPKGAAR